MFSIKEIANYLDVDISYFYYRLKYYNLNSKKFLTSSDIKKLILNIEKKGSNHYRSLRMIERLKMFLYLYSK